MELWGNKPYDHNNTTGEDRGTAGSGLCSPTQSELHMQDASTALSRHASRALVEGGGGNVHGAGRWGERQEKGPNFLMVKGSSTHTPPATTTQQTAATAHRHPHGIHGSMLQIHKGHVDLSRGANTWMGKGGGGMGSGGGKPSRTPRVLQVGVGEEDTTCRHPPPLAHPPAQTTAPAKTSHST